MCCRGSWLLSAESPGHHLAPTTEKPVVFIVGHCEYGDLAGDPGWATENWPMNYVSLRTLAKGVRRMKGKRRTTEEKIRILRQADGERTILEICAENNISEQTFHRWKKEFGLLDVKQAKRLKELEAENTRLKRIVADQVLGMEIIQEALERKL
jgi:putative transposase